ncbi:MAG: CopG family transcriptional regulator [Pusillimonas sp.]|nr:CopG family transcriptional regulator [Pusillimonas sp.]
MKSKRNPLFTSVTSILLASASTLAQPVLASSIQGFNDTDGRAITIYKSPSCGCCQSWVEYLEANGFETKIVNTNNLYEIKQKHNVPREMASCHTALINDLVIEGHVPASDILAYLENPQFNIIGLSVPGMIQGSPGMETGKKEEYQVIAFSANGQQSVFREYKDY